MSTAREICEAALKEAGILGVGQTALAEDINDSFKALTRMIAQWQKRRWIVPALTEITGLGNNQKSNTIGPGGYYDVQRPVDVKGGYLVQQNTGSTPISLQLRKIFSYEDYIRISVKELNSLGGYFFYDGNWPKGNIFIWPVISEQYEAHFLIERQLAFTGVADGDITAGSGYTTGTYTDVPLIGSDTGEDALATIVIASGQVTDVVITRPGRNYVLTNTLTADSDDIGGTGTGFVYTVTELNADLDYEFELPEEYEEAIHYNLAVRLISQYQVSNPSPQTGVLAKIALKTLKVANTQVPKLVMPPNLRGRRWGFNLYNPDGY